MGQGGCIIITNRTPYDFKKTMQDSKQMNAWKFPDTIPSMTESKVYVEWDEGIFKKISKDKGNVYYSIEGTKDKFQVRARSSGRGKYSLKIFCESLNTHTKKTGDEVNLGWKHDGNVSFALTGTSGNYIFSDHKSNGGFMTIVNSTRKDFCLETQDARLMNVWAFPPVIPAKTHKKFYVEWPVETKLGSANSAFATYSLKGTNSKFKVQAQTTGKNKCSLTVDFDSLKTDQVGPKGVADLGWVRNGNVSFVLAAQTEKYFSNGSDAAGWMQRYYFLLGDKTLKDICIVGSHDAGMSKLGRGGTVGGTANNTLTQSNSIGKQLALGARYFDIRPVIGAGDYYTGHYSKVGLSWQGTNGQSIDSIVKEINSFTAYHKELIILNISHTLNTTVGNFAYRSFNKSEWDGLLTKLSKINHRPYQGEDSSKIDLVQTKLGELINGKSSVLIVIDNNGNLDLKKYKTKGFFTYDNFKFYDSYAGTNSPRKMADDQLKKMEVETKSDRLFLLSWTLTQQGMQALVGPSIKALAHEANQCLSYELYPKVSKSVFPNIIYVDDIKTNEAAAMAMAVNTKILM